MKGKSPFLPTPMIVNNQISIEDIFVFGLSRSHPQWSSTPFDICFDYAAEHECA